MNAEFVGFALYTLLGLWVIFTVAVICIVSERIRFWDGRWSTSERTDGFWRRKMKARKPK